MGAEYPGALWVPNGNAFPDREGLTARYIILHGTAGGTSAEAIANYFASTQGTASPASAHFVIGVDGEVVQCNALKDGAWANGLLTTGHDPWWDEDINPNDITVSIEHCKPSLDNSDSLTPAQEASSFKLIAWLCQTLDIPARAADANGGITTHASIDPVNRSRCPGPYPWDALWAFLKGANSMGVPTGWTDDGTTLTAKNGVPMRTGFRNAVLSASNWDPDNVPQEAEYAANPAQLHRADLGAGTRQSMRDGVFWWTQKVGVVYEKFVGLELDAAYKALAAAQTQFANAQKSISALQQQVQLLQSGKPLADLQTRMKQINTLSTI